MLYGTFVITFLVSISAASAISTYTKPGKYNKTDERNNVNIVTTKTTDIIMSEEEITQDLGKESTRINNATDSMVGSETIDQTTRLGTTDVLHVTTTDSLIHDDGYSDSLQLSDKHLNNSHNHENTNTLNINEHFTTETLTTHDTNTHHRKETLFSGKVRNKSVHTIPYHIQNDDDQVQMFILERKKVQLQHHLQLVPMEDEPLGAMMFKNQRYVISILVPIGVGMIGAAMIVCTVLTLRKVARRRALTAPLDDNAEEERPNTPCISSISTETTDKMFLLLGDEEI